MAVFVRVLGFWGLLAASQMTMLLYSAWMSAAGATNQEFAWSTDALFGLSLQWLVPALLVAFPYQIARLLVIGIPSPGPEDETRLSLIITKADATVLAYSVAGSFLCAISMYTSIVAIQFGVTYGTGSDYRLTWQYDPHLLAQAALFVFGIGLMVLGRMLARRA
jgi:hypothetical protein